MLSAQQHPLARMNAPSCHGDPHLSRSRLHTASPQLVEFTCPLGTGLSPGMMVPLPPPGDTVQCLGASLAATTRGCYWHLWVKVRDAVHILWCTGQPQHKGLSSPTREHHSAMKKKEIPPFARTRMDLEGIMLCEISQTEKDKSV